MRAPRPTAPRPRGGPGYLLLCALALGACSEKLDANGQPIKVGRVRLRTFPSGAKVWIDGDLKVESTPATLLLNPGVYQLKLQLEGAEPAFHKLTIEAGDVDTLEIKVPKPEPATLTVLSDIEGAKVRVNGYTRGYTPLVNARTKPGSIDITVTDPISRKAKSVRAELAISEQKVVEVFFADVASIDEAEPPPSAPMSEPPPTGSLTLGLKPDGRVLDVEGKSLGDTPLVDVPLGAGEHELTLESLDGRYRKMVEIEVEAGKKAVFRFRFDPADQVPGWKADAGPGP